MYTFNYDSHNHRVTIINKGTQKGITMNLIGQVMSIFLKDLVFQANKNEIEQAAEVPALVFSNEATENVTDLRNVIFSNGTSSAHQTLMSMLDAVGRESFVAGVIKVLNEYTEPTLPTCKCNAYQLENFGCQCGASETRP